MDKDILMEIQFPQGYNIYKVRKFDWQFNIDLTVVDLNSEGPIKIQSLYKGDINIDGDIKIVDILSVVNIILE